MQMFQVFIDVAKDSKDSYTIDNPKTLEKDAMMAGLKCQKSSHLVFHNAASIKTFYP